ncbi:MAG: hypothetical protein KAJ42_03435 [Gemmatimonadetes bacterium]|nr:hypothetical protein [Gemmatimonadota bacterium]
MARGFAPTPEALPKPKEKTPDIQSVIAGITKLVSAADAKALPDPSNSPPMSSFKNLGGISGRKSG